MFVAAVAIRHIISRAVCRCCEGLQVVCNCSACRESTTTTKLCVLLSTVQS